MGRALGFLSIIITMAIGMYLYSVQVKTFSPSAGAGTPEEAALIAGVKNDLISIAGAERGYLASQGRFASFEELVAGNYLTIKGQRPPYVYEVEATPGSFRATATRTTKGSPAKLWITDTMEVETSD